MKTGYKVMLGALAFVVTNVYAAEIMKKTDFDKVASEYTKIGTISTTGENVAAGRQRRFNQKGG